MEIPAVALIGKGKGIAMTYKWIDGDPLGGAVYRLEAGREKGGGGRRARIKEGRRKK